MSSRGTPNTPFRIPPDVKQPAATRAETDRVKGGLTEVVVTLLREYGARRLDLPDPTAEQD